MTAGMSGSFLYRKRPIAVEARKVGPANFRELAAWCGGAGGYKGGVPAVEITTLEGTMTALCGDWIVKGVAGEFHPVRDDIFRRSYDRAGAVEGKTPGQAVYEAHQAFMIRCFPGIAPIAWDELSVEAQAEWEDIARAGIAAYIEANGGDPVDPARVIAEAVVPELAELRGRLASRDALLDRILSSFGKSGNEFRARASRVTFTGWKQDADHQVSEEEKRILGD